MSDLQACCVCLVTDVKLFDICKNNLQEAYEELSGFKLFEDCIQYTCSYCGLMLRKFEEFKSRCTQSRDYLVSLMTSSEYIQIQPVEKLWAPFLRTELVIDSYNEEYNDIKQEPPEPNDEFNDAIDKSDDELYNEQDKVVIKSESFDEFHDEIDLQEDFSDSMQLVLLSKQEQLQEVEARKKSHNYRTCLYKCDKCYKGFLTETTFANHMVRHDPQISGSKICDICQFCWPDKHTLYTHVQKTHLRRYICKLCNKTCRTITSAREHKQFHSGLKYTCKLCSATFGVKSSYFTHLRLQHPSKHCCDDCGESFVSDKGLRMHRTRRHRGQEKSKTMKFSCSLCKINFTSSQALDRHMDITDHGNEDGEIRCDMKACPKCGDNFPSDGALRDHLRTHRVPDKVKCRECAKTFASEHALAAHYHRVHLGIKHPTAAPRNTNTDYVCEHCGKKCCSWFSLVNHQRTHTGEKPFKCPDCGKGFSVQQQLQIHMRLHTGERPFQCALCPKAFGQKAALNRHDRVHSGAKPYQCTHCPKAFSQSNSMKMHIRTVHLKMPCPYKHKRKNIVVTQ